MPAEASPHVPNWDLDYLDYPTAWWIQEQGYGHTDERCSAVQSNGAFLCDCGAVMADWKRLRAEALTPDTEETAARSITESTEENQP